MYKGLTLITGILLAIMLFFNGMLSGVVGPYFSNLIFHIIAVFFIVILSLITKNKWSNIKKAPKIFFLPGILSVSVIVLNNICIPKLGITLTVGISLFSQLIVSNIIDHFGIFHMPVIKFKPKKLIGFSIILLGIVAMITM
ncbi:DMT family transporter [Dethiothermospora halolimnae]|uniref:DMT family transporter n=1 Tax=Dethiothermospora halolimnae TaxID=3114390 RepID=UPI003CCBCAC3